MCPFLPFIDDEKKYFDMRNKLLGQPTARQSQIAFSAATADMDNDQTDDQIMKPQTTTHKKRQTIMTNSSYTTHMNNVLTP